jgi:hypothetical protein
MIKSFGSPHSSGILLKNAVIISSVNVHQEGAHVGGGIEIPAPVYIMKPDLCKSGIILERGAGLCKLFSKFDMELFCILILKSVGLELQNYNFSYFERGKLKSFKDELREKHYDYIT